MQSAIRHQTISRAQQLDNDGPEAHVLTRGPMHEVFAEIVAFKPEPAIVVTKAPPGVIEDVPPEERQEGNSATWIPDRACRNISRKGNLQIASSSGDPVGLGMHNILNSSALE